jgi:hypothetical protein
MSSFTFIVNAQCTDPEMFLYEGDFEISTRSEVKSVITRTRTRTGGTFE